MRRSRKADAFSIPELLITALVLLASMAVFGEMLMLVVVASVKTSNKVEGIQAARTALNRVASDIRAARGVGDTYAWGTERLSFPASRNPIYGSISGNPPQKGWPAPPWRPMLLSDNVLVLQLPIFYKQPQSAIDGAPLMVPSTSGTAFQYQNVDTVVYQIVQDPMNPQESLLQVARFPGNQSNYSSSSSREINPPVTLLKGIVGPKSLFSPSSISAFSYLSRTGGHLGFQKQTTIVPETVRGIAIDLEIKTTGLSASQGDGRFPENFAVHSEAFFRNYTL